MRKEGLEIKFGYDIIIKKNGEKHREDLDKKRKDLVIKFLNNYLFLTLKIPIFYFKYGSGLLNLSPTYPLDKNILKVYNKTNN